MVIEPEALLMDWAKTLVVAFVSVQAENLLEKFRCQPVSSQSESRHLL